MAEAEEEAVGAAGEVAEVAELAEAEEVHGHPLAARRRLAAALDRVEASRGHLEASRVRQVALLVLAAAEVSPDLRRRG
jgi:CTP:molybdopterin cytidylyltransferase MocA